MKRVRKLYWVVKQCTQANHPDTFYFWPDNFSLAHLVCISFQWRCSFIALEDSTAGALCLGQHMGLASSSLCRASQGWGWGKITPPCHLGQDMATLAAPLLLSCRHRGTSRPRVVGQAPLSIHYSDLKIYKKKRRGNALFHPDRVLSDALSQGGIQLPFCSGVASEAGSAFLGIVNRKWEFPWGLCKSPDTASGTWLGAFTCHAELRAGSFWLEETRFNAEVLVWSDCILSGSCAEVQLLSFPSRARTSAAPPGTGGGLQRQFDS